MRRSPWGRRRRRGPFGGGLHGAAAALRGGGAAPGAVGGGNGGTGVAEAVPTRRGRIAGVETWKSCVFFFNHDLQLDQNFGSDFFGDCW